METTMFFKSQIPWLIGYNNNDLITEIQHGYVNTKQTWWLNFNYPA